ncbi:MAG: hypothetical protein WBG86_01675, partial [Polyangiales bacterium]
MTETARLREAHRAFARGRVRFSLIGAVATVALTLFGWLMGSDDKALWFGAVLMVIATGSLYVGRSAGRAVLPAFAIGLIPFSALLVVQTVSGHGCHTGGCASLCLPTCVLSGLAAGGLLAFVAVRVRAGLGFLGVAAAMIWLVGTLGCPCVGVSSVVGMALGIAVPT